MKKELKIEGMSCKHCVATVEKGLNSLAGMHKVKVNLKKGKATIHYDEKELTEVLITEKMNEIGFAAVVI